MEICPVSGRFPAIPLRFVRIPGSFSTQRAPASPFCPYAASSNLRHDADTVKSACRNRMFILGMGFVGQFFAKELKNQGWLVSGTCTGNVKKKKLEEMGFNAYVFNANEPEPEVLDILNYHTHLLISIPPVVGVGDLMLQHGELLKSKLMDGNLQWLCYLSSTSVYGSCGGAWVDEEYPVRPTSKLAKARLAAEEGWLNLGHDLGLAAHVFRLGGIYGPGRSAIDTILKHDPLSEAQRMRLSRHYTSRVHVADICQALNASIHKLSPGKIYNIVDDDPAPRTEVFTFAWNLVQRKWPAQTNQAISPDRVESYISKGDLRGEKRVSNGRMKKELGVRLTYANYRSGLQSITESMDNPSMFNPSGSLDSSS